MDREEYLRSPAYRRCYKAGKHAAVEKSGPAIVRIQMEDGRLLTTEAVIAELRRGGWDLVPTRPPGGKHG